MSEELARCPFCGGDDLIVSVYGLMIKPREKYCVTCDCGGQTRVHSSKEEAVEAWNCRADGWISVKDRLPPSLLDVLVLRENGTMDVAFNNHADIVETETPKWEMSIEGKQNTEFEDEWIEIYDVVAWIPLPKPPEGNDE